MVVAAMLSGKRFGVYTSISIHFKGVFHAVSNSLVTLVDGASQTTCENDSGHLE